MQTEQGQSWADQVDEEDPDKLGPLYSTANNEEDGFQVVGKKKRQRSTKPKARSGQPTSPPAAPVRKAPLQIVDPRPLPPIPADLSGDCYAIYKEVREHHPYGGITARKIYKILSLRNYQSETTGDLLTLQDIGDILYDQLKIAKHIYPVGEKGPKWHPMIY